MLGIKSKLEIILFYSPEFILGLDNYGRGPKSNGGIFPIECVEFEDLNFCIIGF